MNRKRKDKPHQNITTMNITERITEIEIHKFINEKINYIQEIIRKTILSIKTHTQSNIFSNNDAMVSITILTELYVKTDEITKKLSLTCSQKEIDIIIDLLQKVIDKLSMIICGFGTKNIDDLLFISFGSEYKNINIENPIIKSKYELIKEHITPIGYKIIHWKNSKVSITHNNILCSNK